MAISLKELGFFAIPLARFRSICIAYTAYLWLFVYRPNRSECLSKVRSGYQRSLGAAVGVFATFDAECSHFMAPG